MSLKTAEPKFNYEGALNMTQAEIQTKMKADKSFADTVPVRGPEFNEFANFVGSEPGELEEE